MAIPLQEVLYTTNTHVTGGRDGSGRSSDGKLDVKLDHFVSGKGGTNPEQLFGVGYSACFLSAIGIAAQQLKVRLSPETAVDAQVDLGKTSEGNYQLAVKLNVNLPGVDEDTKAKLLAFAHETCPYSRMTRGEVQVEIAAK
jgi:osmotically inducible protein OsmC